MDELVKSKEDLQELAQCMLNIARTQPCSIYRYKHTLYDSAYFDRGRKNTNHCGFSANYNVEDIENHIYSNIRGEELFPFNLDQFEIWRHRSEAPFIFQSKEIPLPTEVHSIYHDMPDNFEQWDEELQQFTKDYPNERITREFGVEQRIVVNSLGGVLIESRPFFSLHYRQGYHPHMVTRSVGAYAASNADIDRMTALIQYMPDPTPDQRIRKASSFTEAFAHLYNVSNEIHFTELDAAGLGSKLTHDVIMLSGVPIHEIFGHQFEEPVHPLNVGQQSLFPIGKNVENGNIILQDDPTRTIEGLDVLGSYPFDSYGRPAHATTHIADSAVQKHLGGEYIDKKNIQKFMGIERSDSIGCSRQGEEGAFPQPRMSCTVLEGKEEVDMDYGGKIVMIPFDGYVLDGNFFKVMSSECYVMDGGGNPKRLGPLEGSRAIYDALIGMHVLPGKSHHVGTCSKPNVLDDNSDTEVTVSFFTNHQMWEHLTIRTL